MKTMKARKQVKMWKKIILLVIQIIFTITLVIYGIYVSKELNFYSKTLVYSAIGISLYFSIKNISNLHVGQYFPKNSDKYYGHSAKTGCNICGDSQCIKEPYSHQEPWRKINLDSRLDSTIQMYFEAIINNYVSSWYSKYSNSTELTDSLKISLKYAASNLYKRIEKVHIGKLIVRKLIPCGLHHFDLFYHLKQNLDVNQSLEDFLLESPYVDSLHPAVANRESELQYLRDVTTDIMPLLLQKEDIDERIFSVFIGDMFARWVLLPFLDLLANPEIVNTLLILLTNGEKMEEIKDDPFTKVEFLQAFVNYGPKDYHKNNVLRISIEEILQDSQYLYAFIQFMKKESQLHTLQFCLDVDEFNAKLLSPELNEEELTNLHKRAKDIFNMYFDVRNPSALCFEDSLVTDMQKILSGGPSHITQLQTSQALFEAYEYAYNLLENFWGPKFCYSTEFYDVRLKPDPPPDQPPQSTTSHTIKQKNKLKDVIKYRTSDDQLLNFADGLNIYLDTIMENDLNEEADLFNILKKILYPNKMSENDMSSWKITIQEIYQPKMDRHSDYIYVIVIKSYYENSCSNWVVERKEIDFYTLQEKLIEFHGEQLLSSSTLPSNRTGVSNNLKKIKYEEFLQNLVRNEALHTSGLVCLFLTTDEDFAFVAQEEISADFDSVASATLRSKRDSFAPVFNRLLKYCLKEDTTTDVDEETTQETEKPKEEKSNRRTITDGIFKNNFNVEKFNENPEKCETDKLQLFYRDIEGFCDSVEYLAVKVCKLSVYIYGAISIFVNVFKGMINEYVENYVNDFISNIFCQARLASLLTQGYDLIFTDKKWLNKLTPEEGVMKVKEQLRNCTPKMLLSSVGDVLFTSMDGAVDLLQSPQLNKQLVLTLFDIVLAEVFPEVTKHVEEDDEEDDKEDSKEDCKEDNKEDVTEVSKEDVKEVVKEDNKEAFKENLKDIKEDVKKDVEEDIEIANESNDE